MDNFPTEVLCNIAYHLDPPDICAFILTFKYATYIDNEEFWMRKLSIDALVDIDKIRRAGLHKTWKEVYIAHVRRISTFGHSIILHFCTIPGGVITVNYDGTITKIDFSNGGPVSVELPLKKCSRNYISNLHFYVNGAILTINNILYRIDFTPQRQSIRMHDVKVKSVDTDCGFIIAFLEFNNMWDIKYFIVDGWFRGDTLLYLYPWYKKVRTLKLDSKIKSICIVTGDIIVWSKNEHGRDLITRCFVSDDIMCTTCPIRFGKSIRQIYDQDGDTIVILFGDGSAQKSFVWREQDLLFVDCNPFDSD